MKSASAAILDLDGESRRALEFDELLAWVASFARTPLGVQRITSCEPSSDVAKVRSELAAVSETRRYLDGRGKLLAGPLPDPSAALAALDVVDLRLQCGALRELASVVRVAAELGPRLLALDAEDQPQLRQLGLTLPDLAEESRAVLDGTDGRGRILDTASEELRTIRSGATRVSDRLRRLLQRCLHEPGAESVIRDDFITRRNGRFVIPVRTDAPRPVRGIVHASSSSGATRFIEPLESVELNNELVRLAEEEREEQERILAAWTESFRVRRPEVEAAIHGVGRIDELQARALFAEDARASIPHVVAGGKLRMQGARHPLLDRRLREQGAACVPANLSLGQSDRVLVLSGPNTGGKTVALKTVGLAVLMAQSGIPVPARELELPLYRQVRADIGDHQSIQADLSTYSAHIRAVVSFLAAPLPPALFLFDEIGTGTEPAEGAALAQSILESLLRPGCTTLATTHLGAVKAWAVTREGATSAAMEFDAESLRPTYRILMGAAGVSAGLEIAERLGLDVQIVSRARSRMDPRARESEDHLRRLRDALTEAETTRGALRRREERLAAEHMRFEGRMEREARERRQRADNELERALEAFRRAGRRELAALQKAGGGADLERRWRRSEKRMQLERSRQRAELTTPEAAAPGGWVDADELGPGMRVFVRSLAREGEVGEVHRGGEIDVRLGGMTLRVHRSDLAVAGKTATGRRRPGRPDQPEKQAAQRVSTSMPAPRSVSRELLLVGRRVEEALDELDRFLDSAQLAGHDEVRVIHGHGTGRLRSAVREFLDAHTQVVGHRPGGEREGGEGATVVTLR